MDNTPTHDHDTVAFEYSHITDQVFIGTNQCCQTHFDEALRSLGLSVVISLEEEHLDAPYGVEVFLWLPTKDHAAPTYSALLSGVQLMQTLIQQGKKIFVHCKNGHGRAPTLAAAYFISQGMSQNDAVALIKSMRPAIHLEPSQEESLAQFAVRASSPSKNHEVYTCGVCGLKYLDANIAQQCEQWCAQHKSCNLDIIKHALPS